MNSDSSIAIIGYCILGFLTLSSCFITCRKCRKVKRGQEHFPILNSAPDLTPEAEHPFFRL